MDEGREEVAGEGFIIMRWSVLNMEVLRFRKVIFALFSGRVKCVKLFHFEPQLLERKMRNESRAP